MKKMRHARNREDYHQRMSERHTWSWRYTYRGQRGETGERGTLTLSPRPEQTTYTSHREVLQTLTPHICYPVCSGTLPTFAAVSPRRSFRSPLGPGPRPAAPGGEASMGSGQPSREGGRGCGQVEPACPAIRPRYPPWLYARRASLLCSSDCGWLPTVLTYVSSHPRSEGVLKLNWWIHMFAPNLMPSCTGMASCTVRWSAARRELISGRGRGREFRRRWMRRAGGKATAVPRAVAWRAD